MPKTKGRKSRKWNHSEDEIGSNANKMSRKKGLQADNVPSGHPSGKVGMVGKGNGGNMNIHKKATYPIPPSDPLLGLSEDDEENDGENEGESEEDDENSNQSTPNNIGELHDLSETTLKLIESGFGKTELTDMMGRVTNRMTGVQQDLMTLVSNLKHDVEDNHRPNEITLMSVILKFAEEHGDKTTEIEVQGSKCLFDMISLLLGFYFQGKHSFIHSFVSYSFILDYHRERHSPVPRAYLRGNPT